jgi:hypothetical protein
MCHPPGVLICLTHVKIVATYYVLGIKCLLENVLQKPGARQCLAVVQAIAVANAAVIGVADVSPVVTSPINVNVIVTEPRLVEA